MKILFPVVFLAACAMLTTNVWAQTGSQTQSTPTLKSQLDEMAKQSEKRFPAEMVAKMKAANDSVRETGIEKSAKQMGDLAPDAELKNWNGETVRLSEMWSQRPIVLMWYRGGWCPYCNLQLKAINDQLDAIQGAGAKLVVLTPELPEKAKETADNNSLSMVALHDPNNETAKKYGIVFALPEAVLPLYRDQLKLAEINGNPAMELPLAATYVINTDGVIKYAFLDADYKHRAEPADVLAAVKKTTGQGSTITSSGPPKVGEMASDFELKTPGGETVSLKQSLTNGPTVIVVLRGFPGYQCPICSRQVGGLIQSATEFQQKNAHVILVYPGPAKELGDHAKEFLDDSTLPENFQLVIDPDYKFTEMYGLRWDAPNETAYPSTFVVSKDGKITYAKISKGHGGRTDSREIISAIE